MSCLKHSAAILVVAMAGTAMAEECPEDPGEAGCEQYDTLGSNMVCRTAAQWDAAAYNDCLINFDYTRACGILYTVPCMTAGGQPGYRFTTFYCCP
jgi:hypothetical protein